MEKSGQVLTAQDSVDVVHSEASNIFKQDMLMNPWNEKSP